MTRYWIADTSTIYWRHDCSTSSIDADTLPESPTLLQPNKNVNQAMVEQITAINNSVPKSINGVYRGDIVVVNGVKDALVFHNRLGVVVHVSPQCTRWNETLLIDFAVKFDGEQLHDGTCARVNWRRLKSTNCWWVDVNMVKVVAPPIQWNNETKNRVLKDEMPFQEWWKMYCEEGVYEKTL